MTPVQTGFSVSFFPSLMPQKKSQKMTKLKVVIIKKWTK